MEECLWSLGSLRLIGKVPGIEGVKNGVGSEKKGKGNTRNKLWKIGKKRKESERRGGEKRKEKRE